MFEKSDNINELAAALAKAQAVLQPAEKDRANPFFKSKYATLESVATTCRAALAENGLAVVQTPEVGEYGSALRTTLVHSSGQWISGVMRLHGEEKNMQAMGSAISYARRYGLAAIVGVVTDEDDDGNAAAGRDKAQQQPKRPAARSEQSNRQPPAPAENPATPQQVKRVSDLLSRASGVTDELLDKWFRAARVEAWDQMKGGDIAKCIKWLEERVPAADAA